MSENEEVSFEVINAPTRTLSDEEARKLTQEAKDYLISRSKTEEFIKQQLRAQ